MTQEQAHQQPETHDDPLALPLLFWSLIGALLVITAIILLTALYYHTEHKMTAERVYSVPNQEVTMLHAQQDGTLSTPHWIDRNAGVVQIPIDDAIRRVCRELRESTDGTGPWSPRTASEPAPTPAADNAESSPPQEQP